MGHPHYAIVIAPEGTPFPDPIYNPSGQFDIATFTGSITQSMAVNIPYTVRIYAVSAFEKARAFPTDLVILYDGTTTTTRAQSPINLNIRQVDSTQVQLSWEIQPEPGSVPNSYNVYLAEDLTTVVATTTHNSFFTNILYTPAGDGKLNFRVASVKGTQESRYSDVSSVVFDRTPPAAPNVEIEAAMGTDIGTSTSGVIDPAPSTSFLDFLDRGTGDPIRDI